MAKNRLLDSAGVRYDDPLRDPTKPPLGLVILAKVGGEIITDTVVKILGQGATVRTWKVVYDDGTKADIQWGGPDELGTPIGLADNDGATITNVVEKGPLWLQWNILTRRGFEGWLKVPLPNSGEVLTQPTA